MEAIWLKAYAKVNLVLDVLGKRTNGYHDVRMVMQTINLYDKLNIKRNLNSDISLSANLPFLPVDERNLVYAATKLFLKHAKIDSGVQIYLEKNIPVAAGMAGGSSDAACTLYGLNKLFHTGYSLKELQTLGVKLGADVPYCLLRGTALSEGIGELLTPLPSAPFCYCVVVKPSFAVSTKYVYENLILNEETSHPEVDAMLDAIHSNNYPVMCGLLGNVLETVTLTKFPEIQQIKKQMLNFGADNALMSGSGPTVFGLFNSFHKAKNAYCLFKSGPHKMHTFLTEFIQPNCKIDRPKS